jgi:hypothetical protein
MIRPKGKRPKYDLKLTGRGAPWHDPVGCKPVLGACIRQPMVGENPSRLHGRRPETIQGFGGEPRLVTSGQQLSTHRALFRKAGQSRREHKPYKKEQVLFPLS